MKTSDEYHHGVAYLVVRYDWEAPVMRRLVPVKVTRRHPTVVDADCVVLRVNMEVAKEAFEPLTTHLVANLDALARPAAQISASTGLLERHRAITEDGGCDGD